MFAPGAAADANKEVGVTLPVFGTTYIGACQGLVDNGLATGPCAHPNDLIPTSRGTVYATITFAGHV
ncbi:MAG: hypothetical protein ACTHQQ_23615 [Solirubrobacteraceae bacterium]